MSFLKTLAFWALVVGILFGFDKVPKMFEEVAKWYGKFGLAIIFLVIFFVPVYLLLHTIHSYRAKNFTPSEPRLTELEKIFILLFLFILAVISGPIGLVFMLVLFYVMIFVETK